MAAAAAKSTKMLVNLRLWRHNHPSGRGRAWPASAAQVMGVTCPVWRNITLLVWNVYPLFCWWWWLLGTIKKVVLCVAVWHKNGALERGYHFSFYPYTPVGRVIDWRNLPTGVSGVYRSTVRVHFPIYFCDLKMSCQNTLPTCYEHNQTASQKKTCRL